MDGHQQPIVRNPLPAEKVATTIAPGPAAPNLEHDSKLDISDAQARALLTINNLQSGHVPHKSTKPPIGLLVTFATVVLLVVIASFVLGNHASRTNLNPSSSNSATPSSSRPDTNNSSTTNQINQDVNSCSNPLIAVSQC